MMRKVRVNWRSMNAADAAAPKGSHQVLATKKYVLANVISQIKSSNARPIPQPSWAQSRISPRPLPRPTTQATVGGECNTATREQCKGFDEEIRNDSRALSAPCYVYSFYRSIWK